MRFPDDGARVVIYGDMAMTDPYDSDMLAVMWDVERLLTGDGGTTPVTVRERSGVAAPFTVFQQVVLPEMGTVITWEEDGRFVALLGRGYGAEQVDELIAFADGLVAGDDGFELPPVRLPAGHGTVFEGAAARLGLLFAPREEYRVTYSVPVEGARVDPGVTVTGSVMSPAEFDAVRFFVRPLDRRTVRDREVFVGNAWTDDGPAVVTWREPGGLAVRLIGFDVGLDDVLALAESARPLDRAEWEALSLAAGGCTP